MSSNNNNPRQNSGERSSMGRLMEKIKNMGVDESRPPSHHGYQRVERDDGTFSTSDTSTSLDKVLIDIETDPLGNQPATSINLPAAPKQRSFGPGLPPGDSTVRIQLPHKSALKNPKVSFERETYSSDEDDFSNQRHHFQGKGAQKSDSIDHKSILKDLKNILDDENRRDFQSKKHVSLDLKHTRFLENILKNSSSEEENEPEFEDQRKHFQARKHQSLDPKVTFKLHKEGVQPSDSDDALERPEFRSLIRDRRHDSNSIIIDLKDFQNILLEADEEADEEEIDEEDLVEARKAFQAQKSLSTASRISRHSFRFFEMDELTGGKKGENLRNSIPIIRQITEDGKPMLEIYRPTTNPIYIYTQILAALSVSMGSLVVGYASSYSSPAMVSLTDRNITSFEVTTDDKSWIGGIMPLAALVGSFVGGPMLEYIGRRNTIMAIAVPFSVAWLFIALASSSALILVGRALSGFCIGIATLSLPVYLGETVQPEVRGTLGLLPTAFGNIGILLGYAAGYGMDWSELAFLGAALPIPFLILMFFIPETPRWYVSRGREPQARKALQWLRGREADIEPELKGIMRSQADADRQQSQNIARELLQRNNLKPLTISLGLMLFQQLSGINAVIFYTETIFKETGSTMDSSESSIIIGCVNFIATFVATMLIDRLGRKMLLYISSVVMVISLVLLGLFFYFKHSGADLTAYDKVPLICLMGYVTAFSLGFGPIPWLMMGEILPGKIRGSAASVATAFNWTCTFIVTKTFPQLLVLIYAHGTFWLFSGIVFVGFFFVLFCVPETQGKTLEDIERKMNGRVRRMSSVANIKPLSFNM